MLWRTALRSDPTSALALAGARSGARYRTVRSGLFCVRAHCIVSRSRRRIRYVRFAHTARTDPASQLLMRAACAALRTGLAGRAGPGGPAVRQAITVHRTGHVRAHLLTATEIAPAGHRLSRHTSVGFRRGQPTSVAKARPGRLQRASGAPRSAGLAAPARSAVQQLTRRGCLNAASKASVVSSAAGRQDRASQGSRSEAQTAPAKRCGLPGRAFVAPNEVRKSKLHEQQRSSDKTHDLCD